MFNTFEDHFAALSEAFEQFEKNYKLLISINNDIVNFNASFGDFMTAFKLTAASLNFKNLPKVFNHILAFFVR
jgi:hypothetical protein